MYGSSQQTTSRSIPGCLTGNQAIAKRTAAAVVLDTLFYNFARPHKTLANPYPRTPAMAAGIADHIWSCEEIADPLD